MGKLDESCMKFIQNQFPLTYRNTKEYVNKSRMRLNQTWGGDIDLFYIALILKTDIWVHTSDMGNKWMIYSGKGANLGQIMDHLRRIMQVHVI